MAWDAQADEVLVCCWVATLGQRRPVVHVLGFDHDAIDRTALAERITAQLGVTCLLP